MTNKKLLELAAKAAGYELDWFEVELGDPDCYSRWYCDLKETRISWNPLIDDGDALRLAVKLKMIVDPYAGVVAIQKDVVIAVLNEDDMMAAVRRAIVRAAAEIGKEMK